MEASHSELVGIFVGTCRSQIIGLLEGVGSRDGKGESLAFTKVFDGLVVGLKIEGDHVHIDDASPGHHHNVNTAVFVVSAYHIGRHREKIGLCS